MQEYALKYKAHFLMNLQPLQLKSIAMIKISFKYNCMIVVFNVHSISLKESCKQDVY